VPHSRARDLVVAHHYARGTANTSQAAHGLFRGDDLVGAALWMPPIRPAAVRVLPHAPDRVIALSRLVVIPGEPQNCATLLLGASLRLLRRTRRWDVAITFADKAQGHTGAIYLATNWSPDGESAPERLWFDADGRQVARKAGRS